MSLEARAAIAALEPYRPPARGAGLRLDYNENTRGCSPAALEALRAATAEELARYPEPEAAEAGFAPLLGLPARALLLTHGVDEAIALAAQCYLEPGAAAAVVSPAFAMYAFYSRQAGAKIVPVPCGERSLGPGCGEFVPPPPEALPDGARIVFLATPNNPTGHATPASDILAMAERRPRTLIFVDETYADFLPPEARTTLLTAAAELPNLAVARSFSKAHGLAGVRLGYLAGNPAWLETLRRARSPYSVSTLAVRCGRAALADAAWNTACRGDAARSRARIEAELAACGLFYWKSAANFVLFDAGERAAALLAALRRRGVWIRDRSGDRAGALRISCGTSEETERACAALRGAWEEVR